MLCSKTISRDTGRGCLDGVSPIYTQPLIPPLHQSSASTASHLVLDASEPFLYLELFGMQMSDYKNYLDSFKMILRFEAWFSKDCSGHGLRPESFASWWVPFASSTWNIGKSQQYCGNETNVRSVSPVGLFVGKIDTQDPSVSHWTLR
jgi:hypothetical protein